MEALLAFLFFLVLILLIIGLFKPKNILMWSKNPTRLKVFGLWIATSFILLILLGFYTDSEESFNESNTTQEIDVENVIKQISVRYETQGIHNGKMKVVVWIKNESEYIFNSDLSVSIKTANATRTLGYDLITIENLNPTQETYAIIWVDKGFDTAIEYEWKSPEFSIDKTSVKYLKNTPYKFLKEKVESGNKIEFYLATDRDYKKMYDFMLSREINEGVFYHAVFVDEEKYAQFSKYPITAMTFDEEQSKHIIAKFEFNTNNEYKNFTYYEKNSWESSPKKIE